jgi:hypothetical protein
VASVVRINVTPVKGLALLHPDAVELTDPAPSTTAASI